MEYVDLHKSESYGADGSFGLEIKVAASNLPDLKATEIWRATQSATELIEAAIRKNIKASDPKTAGEIASNRRIVDEVFPEHIFTQELDNKYCSHWCCTHLPWFSVTTKIGIFIIGWRKRVISINWVETVGTETAETLFPNENVTKGEKSIHAWSLEDAKKYVGIIMKRV